jgi:hypothetical protein
MHTLWELRLKFNSLTNPNLIDEMDAVGQGRPGLGARLEYRAARLGPSMYMPSMLSRPKYPVVPTALDAGSAGHPDWPGIASSFRAYEYASSAFSIRLHGRCALEIDFWLLQSARFASGAWLAPFQR